jgi:hypothetical protein
MSLMTQEPQRKVLLSTYFDLEICMQEYRKTLLWLTHGNTTTHRPTVQEARHQLEVLRERITALLSSIDSQLP